jgi:glycosyltransferase involved in cell wall biosynthesis
VALVHDYLVATGGAERVLLSLHRLFPQAPIFTSLYRPRTTFAEFGSLDVRPLWPNALPVDDRSYRPLVAFYAAAFERLRLDGYDLVLSDASGFAKSAGAGARARLCYCYTPPRFIWPCGTSSDRVGRAETVGRVLMRPALRRLDRAAARRVDRFVVTSNLVRQRVQDFYQRDAEVVNPPVDTELFTPGPVRDGGYLVVGRLAAYRGFDVPVRVLSELGLPLTVVGSGPEESLLRQLAGPTVTFAGRVGDIALSQLYGRARALIVPGEEDWGLAALEANASGCPVIAAAVGGSLETVVDGRNGVLYDRGAPGALAAAIARLEQLALDPVALRDHAQRFSEGAFHARMGELAAATLSAA